MSGLAYRSKCERCGVALDPDGAAYICSYECTYCAVCHEALERRCSNCGGELVRRPRPPVKTWGPISIPDMAE